MWPAGGEWAVRAEEHLERVGRLVVFDAADASRRGRRARRRVSTASSMKPILSTSPSSWACSAVKIWPVVALAKCRVVVLQLRPALGDDVLEALEAAVDQLLQQLALFARSSGVSSRVGLPMSLSLLLATESSFTSQRCEQAGEVVVRNDHADRAGPGRRLGVDDVVGRRPRPWPGSSRRWRTCRPC